MAPAPQATPASDGPPSLASPSMAPPAPASPAGPARWRRRADRPRAPGLTPARRMADGGCAGDARAPPARGSPHRRGPTGCVRQSHSTVTGPICWDHAACSTSASVGLGPRRRQRRVGNPSQATVFHGGTGSGGTPEAAAISLSVRSRWSASKTTFALNSPRGWRHGGVIASCSSRGPEPNFVAGPNFGEHYRIPGRPGDHV